MSRLVSLLIVLLAIAVATPVLAEQRLSLSGQMRVRGLMIDNLNWNDDVNQNTTWNDQRLRISGRLAVAEGVSVNFRQDLSVGDWGGSTATNTDPRAWLNVDVGMVNVQAGRMYHSLGNAIAVDTDGSGAVITLKGEIPVQFSYFKLREDQYEAVDTGQPAPRRYDDDVNLYTLSVGHSTDLYSATVFGGYLRDGGVAQARVTAGDDDNFTDGLKKNVYLVGTQANFNLDPVNVNFEVNYFTGKTDLPSGVTETKYRGLQLFADAGMAISETINAGLILAYAKGYSDKTQVTSFTTDGNFMPETYSFMMLQYNPLPGNTDNSIFRLAGNNSGSRAVQGYMQAKIIDGLTARAMVGYATPDKKNQAAYKSFLYGSVSARYQLAARTNLDAVYAYTDPSARTLNGVKAADDARQILGFNLNVNF